MGIARGVLAATSSRLDDNITATEETRPDKQRNGQIQQASVSAEMQ